jgi:uncharacterized protein YfaS (alpha-2-macroglobulin family)
MKPAISKIVTAFLILLITNTGFASTGDKTFVQLWKDIDLLIEKSLPKSAMEVLDIVHDKAIIEKNDTQLLKSVIFRFKLFEMTEENHLEVSINYAKSQFDLLQSPSKQWLHSILAELYVFYYQQHRYEWLSRTNLVNNDSDDLNEWDLGKLQSVIQSHYEQSVKDIESLQNRHLSAYIEILENTEKESINKQPTAYDFLVQRLIAYYLSPDAGVQKPAAGITFSEPKAWSEGAVFVKLHFTDSENPQVNALHWIQQLMLFHINDKNPDAYFQCDLQRLELVRNLTQKQDDTDLKYLNALESLQQSYNKQAISTEAAALRARFLLDQNYNAESIQDSVLRWNTSKALVVCENAITQFPESRGTKSCMILKQEILEKSMQLSVQNVELPNKPIALLLGYKNITNVSFRLIKTTHTELDSILNIDNQETRKEAFLHLKANQNWQAGIPFEADYHNHSTILNLPALETGLYILLASADKDLEAGSVIAFTNFQVSRLSYIHTKRENVNIFYVLDRETGKPVKNAQVTIKSRNYDYKSRKYTFEVIDKMSSGNDGKIEIIKDDTSSERAFFIEIDTPKDKLYSDNYFDNYFYKPDHRKQIQTFLFTDRAIYRPGQTVFFKGIVIELDENEKAIKVKHSEKIRFFDTNNQEMSSIKLTTNDFGSFEGSFTIPTGILNGSMRLTTEHGSKDFNVEEYKRPTFEVNIESPDSQFALNEMVTINGKAMAFAGFGLDSVTFSYEVEREQQFPYWRYCWGWPPYVSEKTIIAHGDSFTKKDGGFEVEFKLIPDESTNSRFDPVFVYTVTVDVTDRNGETRTGSNSLSASSKALIINTNTEDKINTSEIEKYKVSASNLQGKAVKAIINQSVYLLATGNDIERPQLLQKPDRQLLTDKELRAYFPLDNFYQQTDPEKRSKKLVFNRTIEVDSIADLFPKEAEKWDQGSYYIVLTALDNYGKEVKLLKEFILFNEKSKEVPGKSFAWSSISITTAEPDDTIEFHFGSAAKNNRVLIELSAGTRIIQSEWLLVNNEKINIPYIVKEEDRGSLRFEFTYIRHNRLMNSVSDVNIPFTNKMLDIQIETKRDRLTPGMKDTWTVSVKGKNKEQIQSELMAAMYDASLDAFVQHNWLFSLLPYRPYLSTWTADHGFSAGSSSELVGHDINLYYPQPILNPSLNWFGLSPFVYFRGGLLMAAEAKSMRLDSKIVMNEEEEMVTDQANAEDVTLTPEASTISEKPTETQPSLRTNFNETAFFYPQLKTDNDGLVTFSFQLPDALTKWKLLLLAHSKDLKTGTAEYSFTASKDLMIMPNLPRFYREGDTAFVQAKIVNTGKEAIIGTASIEISDAFNGRLLSDYFTENQSQVFETIEPGMSKNIRWKIIIGKQSSLIRMKLTATAGLFTDSEAHQIPVLPQKTLVTESLVLNTNSNSNKVFSFSPLNKKDVSQIERLEIQLCSNPSWYAIQALPYLINDDFDNAESIFNRFYANALASIVAQNIPEAMKVIDQWKTHQPDELLSGLEKNQHLKSVLLQETPWVMEAKDESDQKSRIGLLFDINRMQYERSVSLNQLRQLQTANGAWTWFPGMPESAYITNRIVAGLGKINKLNARSADARDINQLVIPAIEYLDQKLSRDYEKLISEKQNNEYKLRADHLNYLYARSFFTDKTISENTNAAFEFIMKHLETDWKTFDKGMQAMAAVALNRFGKQNAAKAILASLREHAIHNPDLGMYWKSTTSYHWYEAPIESQALIINAFEEIEGKSDDIDQMRTWILSQKQTNRWKTNSATAEAIYALLLRGTDWINDSKPVELKVGKVEIGNISVNETVPMFTKVWKTNEITPDMSFIGIKNPNSSMSWGGAFRQYFIDIDKVKASKTPLQLTRELYVERIGESGKELVSTDDQSIKVGDKVIVRIVLTVDRDMEFVHLKDQRAAAFEPTNVLSGYAYKGGLGYYQTTKDASTDFFFDYLRKGKYVFEYELVASQSGEFSNGRALIECYYAPEFSSHSDGLRVKVVN